MEPNTSLSPPELWGGLECTINRVGDCFYDQLEATGHYERTGDIGHFAQLGIKKLRYPILWEHHQADEFTPINWEPTRARLVELRDANVSVIVGLLHHGSGPVFTNLLDPAFPEKLSDYAGKCAAQFPWILYYTPVNEPLTTARFSGLYGYWYPHRRDELSCFRILLNQLKGTVLSMKAIRAINPFAKLVQTEDLAKIHARPALYYQADFENIRRWLTWDLLCGKVDTNHYFWNYMLAIGIDVEDLQFFIDNTCPPDIIGCNYYVTSERWLDDRLDLYPDDSRGGNGGQAYTDTEAARSGHMQGLKVLLQETWDRYQLPMAITECHINCSREEQLRWFNEAWSAATQLKADNIPVIALTAWSLLGAIDWDSLLTKQHGHYESGLFDLSAGNLRPTALAKMLQSLTSIGSFDHPVLSAAGWWNPERLLPHSDAYLLFIGGDSMIRDAMAIACKSRFIAFKTSDRFSADNENGPSPWGYIDLTDVGMIQCSGGLQLYYNAESYHVTARVAIDLLIDNEDGIWSIDSMGSIVRAPETALA